MADFPRWDQIAESEQFRSLDNGARAKLRDAYFQDFVAPTIGPEEVPKAKAEWQKLASIEVPGVGSDIKNTLSMGVQGLALDARELARRALPEGAINAIDSIDTKLHGKPSEEFIKGNI